MGDKEKKGYIQREDYEIGALIGKMLRNRLFHSSIYPKGLHELVTFGIFGIMMKYFSEIDCPPIEVPESLKFMVMKTLIPNRVPFGQLEDYLNDLEKTSRIVGWHGNIYRELEECGLKEEQDTLKIVFDTLSEARVYSSGDLGEIYVAAAVQFILSIGEQAGTGLSSVATIPLEVLQLLKLMADIKDEHVCYGATSESVVLLPFIAPNKDNKAMLGYVRENYAAAVVMLQIMVQRHGRNKFISFAQSCVPVNSADIIGKCDRAFAFPPLYRQLIQGISESFDSDKMRRCIAWWPDNRNSGQWLYARHIISSLNENGIGYVFMPLGMLSRMGGIEEIRRRIIEENILDTVIEFPGGTFIKTNATIALLVLKKGRKTNDVQMVNLAGREGRSYITVDTRHHSIAFKGLNEIEKIIRNRTKIEGLSHIITCEKIAKNAYCFSPGAYAADKMEIDAGNLTDLVQEMEHLQLELVQVNDNYNSAISRFYQLKEYWENGK